MLSVVSVFDSGSLEPLCFSRHNSIRIFLITAMELIRQGDVGVSISILVSTCGKSNREKRFVITIPKHVLESGGAWPGGSSRGWSSRETGMASGLEADERVSSCQEFGCGGSPGPGGACSVTVSVVDAGQSYMMTGHSLEARHSPETRFFCLANRQMTRRTGAQVTSKDTRAMIAAMGQDIVSIWVAHLWLLC